MVYIAWCIVALDLFKVNSPKNILLDFINKKGFNSIMLEIVYIKGESETGLSEKGNTLLFYVKYRLYYPSILNNPTRYNIENTETLNHILGYNIEDTNQIIQTLTYNIENTNKIINPISYKPLLIKTKAINKKRDIFFSMSNTGILFLCSAFYVSIKAVYIGLYVYVYILYYRGYVIEVPIYRLLSSGCYR